MQKCNDLHRRQFNGLNLSHDNRQLSLNSYVVVDKAILKETHNI